MSPRPTLPRSVTRSIMAASVQPCLNCAGCFQASRLIRHGTASKPSPGGIRWPCHPHRSDGVPRRHPEKDVVASRRIPSGTACARSSECVDREPDHDGADRQLPTSLNSVRGVGRDHRTISTPGPAWWCGPTSVWSGGDLNERRWFNGAVPASRASSLWSVRIRTCPGCEIRTMRGRVPDYRSGERPMPIVEIFLSRPTITGCVVRHVVAKSSL
jgi:hypothetical protein